MSRELLQLRGLDQRHLAPESERKLHLVAVVQTRCHKALRQVSHEGPDACFALASLWRRLALFGEFGEIAFHAVISF